MPETIQLISEGEKKKKGPILAILAIALISVLGAFLINFSLSNQKKIEEKAYQFNIVSTSEFASHKEVPVNVNPKVPAYKINPDLSNVVNAKDLYYYDFSPSSFSDKERELLVKNGFFVKPAGIDEFFKLYEGNRYNYIPNFITTDSILHNYHLVFDFLLRQIEERKLISELKELSAKMLSESLRQYNNLEGTEWENAAKRNVGFFTVASKLLDPSVKIPLIVANEVNQELALIEAHQEIAESPVMNIGAGDNLIIDSPQGPLSLEALKEDYTQYIPRGHYDRTEELKKYFKSMMWYGRLTFRLKNEDEVKSALLITLALNQGNNKDLWAKIYEPINFFVGKGDDISYYQFNELLEKVYGSNPTLQLLLSERDKLTSFVDEAEKLAPPKINSIPIFQTLIQPNREKEIKGFRFMGQRFTIDAAIFQRLVYREVGDKTKSCSEYQPKETDCQSGARCLPKGLDIPAAMGSEEAKKILEEMGETQYACYSENLSKINQYLSGLTSETWTQNLYWAWLYQLLPLLEIKRNGYPSFMQNRAWARKELNTFLASWTELKHDTILYAKQVYAELGGGGEKPPPPDDRGYVEPNPYLYARLVSLLKMTKEGLEARGLLTSEMKENLTRLEQLTMKLKIIAEKELNQEKLTDEEYELIRSYGGQLEHFWFEVNKDELKVSGPETYLQENPAAIIADVATDPNGRVLEEGVGKIFDIYVIVPVDGQLKIAVGTVYSYYEFTWPMSDRLTDKKWRELLNLKQAPELPSWTNAFIAQ